MVTLAPGDAGKPKSVVLPIGALFGAMISITYGATLAKGLFPAFGPEGTSVLRLIAGSIVLTVLMRPWRVRLTRGILLPLAIYGAMLALMNLLFYMALKTIPLGMASALQFIGPLLLATLSSRRWIDFVWIGLAAIGIALMVPTNGFDQPLSLVGIALALGAGACWALYIVYGQKTGRELGSSCTALGMMIAMIVVLPIGLPQLDASALDPAVLLTALLLGIFSSAIPFWLEMISLMRLPARAYGTLTSVEPVIGAIMGLVILHEALTVPQWAGIIAIVAAVLGTAMTLRRAA